MRWDFEVGDFVISRRCQTYPIPLKIYEILMRREKDGLFHAATYEVERRDENLKGLCESWPKIHMEAHYQKLRGEFPKLLYGGTND